MSGPVGKGIGIGKAAGAGRNSPASSEAIVVRDRLVTKMRTMPFFSTFKFSTDKSQSIDPVNVPFAGVYFINEDLTPEGDPNAGEVRFRSMAMYGISIIVQNNDAKSAEFKLDEAWKLLTVAIFADPKMYNWKNAGKPGEVAIQAFTRGNRSHQFGNAGADNATPVAEMRFTLTCDLGTLDYEPVIEDDFEKLHIETRYPAGSDPEEIIQTTAEWTLLVNE
jgi:hypothetical protein